jgi:hypothetical protein
MSGLVIELQRDALDESVAVSNLLRRALVVGRKLGISDFEQWARKELDGYSREDDLPKYRKVVGVLMGSNQFHSWAPIAADENALDQFTHRSILEPLPQLESTLEAGKAELRFEMALSPAQQSKLMKACRGLDRFALFMPPGVLAGILSGARNTVLNWALGLEKQGIVGEGMAFTQKEREVAATMVPSVVNNINHFYGNGGQSQVMTNSPGGRQTIKNSGVDPEAVRSLIADIKREQANLQLSKADRAELAAEIATVEAQLTSPKPKHSIITDSLGTIRRFFEGAAVGATGNLLVATILKLCVT